MNQEHPLYAFGNKRLEAIKKVQRIADALDNLRGSSDRICWGDVADMSYVNELLDRVLELTETTHSN